MGIEEYRIRYRHNHAVKTSYHYYMAENAEQALSFHDYMTDKKHLNLETISVEVYNRYADRWEKVIPEFNIDETKEGVI